MLSGSLRKRGHAGFAANLKSAASISDSPRFFHSFACVGRHANAASDAAFIAAGCPLQRQPLGKYATLRPL